MDWAAEKKVGDKLLCAAKPVLDEEAPLVAKQRVVEAGRSADSNYLNNELKEIFDIVVNNDRQEWAAEAAEKGETRPALQYLDEQVKSEFEQYEAGGKKI